SHSGVCAVGSEECCPGYVCVGSSEFGFCQPGKSSFFQTIIPLSVSSLTNMLKWFQLPAASMYFGRYDSGTLALMVEYLSGRQRCEMSQECCASGLSYSGRTCIFHEKGPLSISSSTNMLQWLQLPAASMYFSRYDTGPLALMVEYLSGRPRCGSSQECCASGL